MSNFTVLQALKRLGVFDRKGERPSRGSRSGGRDQRESGSRSEAETRLRIALLASPDMRRRLHQAFAGEDVRVVAEASSGVELTAALAGEKADLFLLDPDTDFPAVSEIAAREDDDPGASVAVILPSDDIVREVLMDRSYLAILPRGFGDADVRRLLARAQGRRLGARL